jgi:vacuolar-type H+-ATPase subunit C/Vma6
LISAQKYAKTVPRIRAVKSRLVRADLYRELIASTPDDILTLLRDSPYTSYIQHPKPENIQNGSMRVFFERAELVYRYSPKEAKPLAAAFMREEEAKDALIVMRQVYEGKPELPLLPTSSIKDTIAFKIRREPEVLASMQRLGELLEKTWFKPYYRKALRVAQETKSPEIFNWMTLAASSDLYANALSAIRSGKNWVEKIICPFLRYKLAASMANAKAIGLQARSIERVLGEVDVCGFSWRDFRAIYEREPGVGELLVSLKEVFPDLNIDAKLDYQLALEQARKTAYRRSKKYAEAMFSSYPFQPAIVAAILTLAKIELYDIVTIMTSIGLGLKSDDFFGLLISL